MLFNLVYSVLFNLDLTFYSISLFVIWSQSWISFNSISNFIQLNLEFHSFNFEFHSFNSKNMPFILFLCPINSFELFILLFILSKDWPMLFYSRIFVSPHSSLANNFVSPPHHWFHWIGDHHSYSVLQWHSWDPTPIWPSTDP